MRQIDLVHQILNINDLKKFPRMATLDLIQIQGGGHALMFQYPEEFSRIILTFLQS